MISKYLNSLNESQRKELEKKLHSKQSGKCFICDEPIELEVHQVDIDHIIPLNLGGKDIENNFAITHASCNREKQDTNLEIARTIHLFKKIEKKTIEANKVLPDLSNILAKFGGSKSEFKFKIEGNKIKYSFPDIGDNTIYESLIYFDKLSGLKSFFIEVPLEYLHHDELGLNPRKLSDNIIKLIKEFYNKRPQLQIGVGRLNSTKDSKLFIFDGQHKAAAQILLGARKVLLRVFIDPEIELLAITNERAGTVLRQIAFDKSVQRQMGSTILAWKIERFQKDKNLTSDDYSFSESDLVSHFRGEGREIKKFIIDFIRRKIIENPENKIVDYLNFGGREKEKPLSYSNIEKTFYSLFIYGDLLDIRPFFNQQRDNEMSQIVKLMNIIQEEILSGFDFNIGSFKIEERVRKIKEGKSNEVIPDAHLRAFRLCKEEILFNWLKMVKQVIQMYFSNLGRIVDEDKLFQEKFDDRLWNNIRNLLKNLNDLPIWIDRDRTHLFSKKEYGYWQEIFRTGMSPDKIQVLNEGVNIVDMIKR
jgi:hypothetical protein